MESRGFYAPQAFLVPAGVATTSYSELRCQVDLLRRQGQNDGPTGLTQWGTSAQDSNFPF